MCCNRALAVSSVSGRDRMMTATSQIPVALLVGGMGTRLRTVLQGTPKPLAPVGDAPFLELLILQLHSQGLDKLVMCAGYLAEQIKAEFGDGSRSGVAIRYSVESQPLGTAGAVKLARPFLQQASHFLVMNGDSFVEIDFDDLLRFHQTHGGLVSMAVQPVEDAGRYGTVQIGPSSRVTAFVEKTGVTASGLINAGVYVFDRAIFDCLPDGPASLERDVFPGVLGKGIFALPQRGLFIDIGIPEDYARAQAAFDRLASAASRASEHKAQP